MSINKGLFESFIQYYLYIINISLHLQKQLNKNIMPRLVALHQLEDLVHEDSRNEVVLDTKRNTELHIIVIGDKTIIKFPFGNTFNVIDGNIVIQDK